MSSEIMTTLQVAEMLKCSHTYVTLLVKRGHFPGARKMDPTRKNSPYRIPRQDVLAYQEKQLVSPKNQD
jgi:excisionase family DNA binding protein